MQRFPLRASAGFSGIAGFETSERGPARIGLPVLMTSLPLLILAFALEIPPWARIAIGALGVLLVVAKAIVAMRRARAPLGWVMVDGLGIVRIDRAGSATLARYDEPLGLTILTNYTRTRALLAFTTRRQTRYLHVEATAASKARGARAQEGLVTQLFEHAATVSDADVVVGATGDGRGSLNFGDAAQLIRSVRARASSATQRIYLTDAEGGEIVLSPGELRVGERVIDLGAPLEWRGFTFHESMGHAATMYQATWVRQGSSDFVLVAPMPAELTAWGAEPSVRVHGAALRDVRSMQSLPESPPPRELRVAVDRLFMLPLRQALDRAALASRTATPATRRRPERSAS